MSTSMLQRAHLSGFSPKGHNINFDVVQAKGSLLYNYFVKIGTFMFLFTTMNLYMHFKATLLCECFVTHVTFKFLHTGMNLLMINKGISCTDHI